MCDEVIDTSGVVVVKLTGDVNPNKMVLCYSQFIEGDDFDEKNVDTEEEMVIRFPNLPILPPKRMENRWKSAVEKGEEITFTEKSGKILFFGSWSDAEKALAQIKSGGKVGELTKTERREQKKREPYTPPSGNSKKNKPTKQPQKKEDDKIMNKISKDRNMSLIQKLNDKKIPNKTNDNKKKIKEYEDGKDKTKKGIVKNSVAEIINLDEESNGSNKLNDIKNISHKGSMGEDMENENDQDKTQKVNSSGGKNTTNDSKKLYEKKGMSIKSSKDEKKEAENGKQKTQKVIVDNNAGETTTFDQEPNVCYVKKNNNKESAIIKQNKMKKGKGKRYRFESSSDSSSSEDGENSSKPSDLSSDDDDDGSYLKPPSPKKQKLQIYESVEETTKTVNESDPLEEPVNEPLIPDDTSLQQDYGQILSLEDLMELKEILNERRAKKKKKEEKKEKRIVKKDLIEKLMVEDKSIPSFEMLVPKECIEKLLKKNYKKAGGMLCDAVGVVYSDADLHQFSLTGAGAGEKQPFPFDMLYAICDFVKRHMPANEVNYKKMIDSLCYKINNAKK